MTGPEHYREAERLLGITGRSEDAPHACAQLIAEAQVHATLALAAATLGTLEENRLAAIIDDKIHEALGAHREDTPHIYPDGSTS